MFQCFSCGTVSSSQKWNTATNEEYPDNKASLPRDYIKNNLKFGDEFPTGYNSNADLPAFVCPHCGAKPMADELIKVASFQDVIERIVELGFGEREFYFIVKDDIKGYTYSIGVKLINEFSSLLVLIGNSGGGFNMVVLANDNMIDRKETMVKDLKEQFEYNFKGYTCMGFEEVE